MGAHYPKMMTHRTTDKCPRTPALRFFALLTALLLATTHAAFATQTGTVDSDLDVRLVAASEVAPQWPPDLIVEGMWPDSCLPSLLRTRVVDYDIDIYLRSEARACAQVQTAFQLKLNPAREAGREQLDLGIFRVRLFLTHGKGSNELIAFRLLRSGGDDRRARPESGFWWSVPTANNVPALSGNGLSIEQQGDALAVTWLSYESGVPVWYFGSQKMSGKIAWISLSRMVGGGEAFAGPNAAPEIEPGLALNIEFLTPAHANAWLVREQPGSTRAIEVQDLNLIRLPFAEGHPGKSWQGEWALIVGDSVDARIINLVTLATADAETFRVSDQLGSINLHCRVDDVSNHPVASFCTLTDGASVLADFDLVGLDRLAGQDADGVPVRLVRLPR